jgi:uncharacterized membrane protein YedE/YeeE
MSDDAYITMRVVRHAIEGDGLRYNIGDVGVQPATSPLNLIMLLCSSWILSAFGLGTEAAVIAGQAVIGAVFVPAFGCALYLLMCGDKRNSPIAALAAAFAMGIPGTLATAYCDSLSNDLVAQLPSLCIAAQSPLRSA